MPRFLVSLALLVAVVPGTAQTVKNPILDHADPFITPHPVAGRYLLLATTGDNITIWSGPTAEAAATDARIVFTPSNGLRELWSPTLWHMDGRWWVYFTATIPGKQHAIYALESETDNALGGYSFKGALDLQGHASIDPSVLTVAGIPYLMYVTVDSGANEIHMVRLAGPMQPVGAASLIAKPEFSWERVPAALAITPWMRDRRRCTTRERRLWCFRLRTRHRPGTAWVC